MSSSVVSKILPTLWGFLPALQPFNRVYLWRINHDVIIAACAKVGLIWDRFNLLMLLKHVALVSIVASLCSCASLPQNSKSLQTVAESEQRLSHALGANAAQTIVADDHILSFGDPQLEQLLKKAVEESPRYAQALSRVRKADAYLLVERATDLPHVSGDAAVQEAKVSENNGFPAVFVPKGLHSNSRATLGVVWDADIFGRNRAALAAATSEAEAAHYDADQALLLLRTSVVQAYGDFGRIIAENEAASELSALHERELAIMVERARVGLENKSAIVQADTQLQSAKISAIAANGAIKIARYRLAALLGGELDLSMSLTVPKMTMNSETLDHLGADVLAARPDVNAAKLRVQAAAAKVKTARLDFYPNLSLSALAGFQSIDLDQLLLGGSSIPSFGAALHLPIFSGGRLRGAYRAQQADYDTAIASYNEALANALQDAGSSIVRLQSAENSYAAAQKLHKLAQQNVTFARERYTAKLISELPLLSARASALQARLSLEQSRLNMINTKTELIRALGGRTTAPLQGRE
jgi:NodT family efflux transporter outer membrane factor (OMF) lipoprotein